MAFSPERNKQFSQISDQIEVNLLLDFAIFTNVRPDSNVLIAKILGINSRIGGQQRMNFLPNS